MPISKINFGTGSEELIWTFEREIGCKLPLDYARFLKSSNGGPMCPGGKYPHEANDLVIVDVLFGLGVEEDFNLSFWHKECGTELPPRLITIGGDPWGDLIVLNIENSAVYLWDVMRLLTGSSDDRNAFQISSNFDEFIEGPLPLRGVTRNWAIGPNEAKRLEGKKLENVWRLHENKITLQEINRMICFRFSHFEGFRIA